MARPNITFQSIGLRARERVDMVNSSFISASEEMTLIESAWKEFFMKVVSLHEDIFLFFKQIPTTANVPSISLNHISSGDFFKFRNAQHIENGIPREFLRKIDISESLRLSDGRTGKPIGYSIHTVGSTEPNLFLHPVPDRVYQIRVWYVPFMSLRDWLANNGSFYFLAGWDEIMVVSAAIKMKDKEEGDCSVLMVEKQELMEVMLKSITPYDEGEPAAVVQRTPHLSIYDDPFSIEDRLSGIY